MPTITFHGGKLNNKKMFLEKLMPVYRYSYIKSNEYDTDVYNMFISSFTQVDELYKLVKVGNFVDNKFVVRIGYLKEGSKTKPETIWKRGLLHSESEYYTDYQTGQRYLR